MKNVRKAKIKRKVSQGGINCGDGDLNRRGRRDRGRSSETYRVEN